jgi:hypothetical protein
MFQKSIFVRGGSPEIFDSITVEDVIYEALSDDKVKAAIYNSLREHHAPWIAWQCFFYWLVNARQMDWTDLPEEWFESYNTEDRSDLPDLLKTKLLNLIGDEL